jgi:hypothetical protein
MRHNRITVFSALFLTSAAVAFTAAPAVAQTPYDGLWNVTIVTKAGACEPSTRSTLMVADGKVSAPGADVTGSIGREGMVRVSIGGAFANAAATPDREDGTAHPRVCRAAVDGKPHANKPNRT